VSNNDPIVVDQGGRQVSARPADDLHMPMKSTWGHRRDLVRQKLIRDQIAIKRETAKEIELLQAQLVRLANRDIINEGIENRIRAELEAQDVHNESLIDRAHEEKFNAKTARIAAEQKYIAQLEKSQAKTLTDDQKARERCDAELKNMEREANHRSNVISQIRAYERLMDKSILSELQEYTNFIRDTQQRDLDINDTEGWFGDDRDHAQVIVDFWTDEKRRFREKYES